MEGTGNWSLKDRIAVVTGAGRGIGAAIARGLGAAGTEVYCVARTRSEIEATADAIRQVGGRAQAITADVRDVASMQGLAAAIAEQAGGLDIAVLNAGGNVQKGPLLDSDPAAWIDAVTLNMHSVYLGIRLLAPLMRGRDGGRILFTGSAMGHYPTAGNSSYCSAKAGARMITRVAAAELAAENIAVNELVPGPTLTNPGRPGQSRADPHSPFNLPNEWVKQPEDVVPLAIAVLSLAAPGPTGQVFSLARR